MARGRRPTPEPRGYEEIGESLAELLIENVQTIDWVVEVVRVLGYRRRDVEAWIAWYRRKHYAKLYFREYRRKKKLDAAGEGQ